MCLIIAPGKDGQPALLPEDVFKYAYTRNNDGFGAMWTDNGRVQHVKYLGLSQEDEYAKMKELVEEFPNVVFHMRLKTHGRVIPSLCHPFRILHKNRHGKDLFFMHNGVLGAYGSGLGYGQSDTTSFKDKVLVPLLTRNPDALDDPATWDSLNKLTQGSRLIFMDSDGNIKRTSESSWNNRYDLTLSNSYMLPSENMTGNYAARGGYTGGYGDALNDRKPGFTKWRQVKSAASGAILGSWYKEVCPGLLRSEYGTLYRDRGPNVLLTQDDYVREADELNVVLELTKDEEPGEKKLVYIPAEDDLNDDVPSFQSGTKSKVADLDERLRYARIVHNCHDGRVVDRTQLIADLLGMGNREMAGFIKEDPENAETVMSELIEMVFEYNDLISHDPTCEEYQFSMDELVELNDAQHHQASMKTMSDKRKEYYQQLAKAVAASEARKAEGKAA